MNFKLSHVLLLLGVAANLFTVLVAYALGHTPGNQGSGTLFVLFFFPVIWILVFVAAVVAIVLFRNKALPDNGFLRVLGFFICTPIPIIAVVFSYASYKDPSPTTYVPEPWIEYHNGIAYKFLILDNYEGADHVDSRYVADSIELVAKGETAFMKDSTWIYYTGISDTIKVEHYKKGELVKTVMGKKLSY